MIWKGVSSLFLIFCVSISSKLCLLRFAMKSVQFQDTVYTSYMSILVLVKMAFTPLQFTSCRYWQMRNYHPVLHVFVWSGSGEIGKYSSLMLLFLLAEWCKCLNWFSGSYSLTCWASMPWYQVNAKFMSLHVGKTPSGNDQAIRRIARMMGIQSRMIEEGQLSYSLSYCYR